MSEVYPKCLECSQQYKKLLAEYWHSRRKIRKMRKAFAAIECAITHKCGRYAEFIVGECEAYRGENELRCVTRVNARADAETE